MGDNAWIHQISAMQRRMASLYRSAATEATPHELLPVAFEELQNALEELRSMYDEIYLQHEHVLNAREQIEAELQAYQDLYDHAPIAYLVTNLGGTIRQANLAAAALFCSAEKFMVGRSLALFVPEGERRVFRERLIALRGQSQPLQTWEICLQPWRGTTFQSLLTIAVARGPLGRPTAIRWMIQDVARLAQTEGQTVLLQAEVGK